jgi:hypothetical protein
MRARRSTCFYVGRNNVHELLKYGGVEKTVSLPATFQSVSLAAWRTGRRRARLD